MDRRKFICAAGTLAVGLAGMGAASLAAAAPKQEGAPSLGGKTLEAALRARMSQRAYADTPLEEPLLLELLWAAFGVNRSDGRRTAPSALNRQEISIYVARKDGLFLYDAHAGSLTRKLGADLRARTGVQGYVGTAPVNLVYVADMPEGTGTDCFRKKYPERFIDVGICEPHAVTFAAGLAARGFIPAVAIYSTFLQRSYDQVVHDVCLQGLGVKFFLDRAGLVGEDGATHHGVYDIAFLRHIPGMTLMAPKDEAELAQMIATAFATPGPVAVRYPRGVGFGAEVPDEPEILPIGEGELLREGDDALVIALGSRVYPALDCAEELAAEHGLSVAVFNARFVKPLPEKQILDLARGRKRILTVEEGCLAGGFGSAVLECLADADMLEGRRVRRVGVPDQFIEHGAAKDLRARAGIDKAGIKKALLELLGRQSTPAG